MTSSGTGRRFWPLLAALSLITTLASAQGARAGSPNCGVSNLHDVCVTIANPILTGPQVIGVAVTPQDAKVITSWIPDVGASIYLITKAKPSPEFADYSFTWPTQDYLDGSGVLRVQVGSTAADPVDTVVTLSNGNTSDFQHNPSDWGAYLPGTWTGSVDPVVAAVGDGAADEAKGNQMSGAVVAANPALFLYLGDVYQQGSFVEMLNHYGVSSMTSPGAATLWGRLATLTQPTLGNHEVIPVNHFIDWSDYWHGRPNYTSFTFGGVLFFDLDSNQSLAAGSAQYAFVQNALLPANSPPACVVAYWHIPAINGSKIVNSQKALWKLLALNGGDLVLNGHVHNMTQYLPLDEDLTLTGATHMRELVSGAGGHSLGKTSVDTLGRIEWSQGKKAGFLTLSLDGAANAGVATGISWTFRGGDGNPLGVAGSSGSVTC